MVIQNLQRRRAKRPIKPNISSSHEIPLLRQTGQIDETCGATPGRADLTKTEGCARPATTCTLVTSAEGASARQVMHVYFHPFTKKL